MRRTTIIVFLFLTLVIAGSHAQHEHGHGHDHDPDPAETLSEELRVLLNEEMRLIDAGMGRLTSAIASGDWGTAAATAEKIERSFILKQKLTAEQAKELHSKLPEGFIEMDVDFHRTSGKLAKAAKAHDAELAGFYLHRMLDACVSCHATFAPNRFPGLAAPTPPAHHH